MPKTKPVFSTKISRDIWHAHYQYRDGTDIIDHAIQDSWRRVASAAATAEKHNADDWEERFYDILNDFQFLPAGRILAGAGSKRRVTLFNCFVLPLFDDSQEAIASALDEARLTMQQGGGIGCDFSAIKPYANAEEHKASAAGPIALLHTWDAMCTALHSKDLRRGAMMASLRCDHPDVEAFIDAKRRPDVLTNFNLSVQVTDDFMRAVKQDKDYPLVFPPPDAKNQTRRVESPDSTSKGRGASTTPYRVHRVLRARALWDRLLRAAYASGEPGVLFIDRINQLNNLHYAEHITTTNPCGEAPLPTYAACNLGSINLVRFVSAPFRPTANIDLDRIAETVKIAVRLLDNVIDISRFPLAEQRTQALNTRRIGLGITGLADALVLLGIKYGEQRSFDLAAKVARVICHMAYRTSIAIAEEKGEFPLLERERYLQSGFIQSLPADIRTLIRKHGIRNSHLLAIAPTGMISLLANNVSSGIEPIFGLHYQRNVINPEREPVTYVLENYAYRLWRAMYHNAPLPEQFITTERVSPAGQVTMLAAIQPFIDNAISKTIHIPANHELDDCRAIFDHAYDLGLKGCTVFRSNSARHGVIQQCNSFMNGKRPKRHHIRE